MCKYEEEGQEELRLISMTPEKMANTSIMYLDYIQSHYLTPASQELEVAFYSLLQNGSFEALRNAVLV